MSLLPQHPTPGARYLVRMPDTATMALRHFCRWRRALEEETGGAVVARCAFPGRHAVFAFSYHLAPLMLMEHGDEVDALETMLEREMT